MNSPCCCQRKTRTGHAAGQNSRLGRLKAATSWILPSAVLALMPKCPLCLAAYVALGTGITMSGSSAHILMRILTVLCVGTLALCVARLVVKFHQGKQTLNVQPTQLHP